jgi:hypothetical protein
MAMGKLGLGRLLQLVVLLPLLAMVTFGCVLVLETLNTYREVERLSALEQLVVAASRLTIKALNVESAASTAFGAPDRRPSAPSCKRRDEIRTTSSGHSSRRLHRPA